MDIVFYFFRTRPIIRPEISVSFSEDGVHLSRLNSSTSFNGFSFEMCLSYSVRGTTDQHSFRILLGLDADKSTPRALFDMEGAPSKLELTVNLTKQQAHCRIWTAVMRDLNQIQDKLSPIPVRVSVSLIEDEGFLPAGKVTPYLETPNQYWEEQIPVFYECINNGTCAPDLTLQVESNTDSMYMGDSDEVSINVTVTNSADEAFGAKLYVYIPESFELSSFKSIRAESSITCELLAPMETVVSCNIGNPLPSMMTTKFTLSFDVNDVPGHTETLLLNLTTNSTKMEEASTLMDNNHTVTIRLIPKVEVEMGGFSNVKRLVYKERENDDGDYSHEQEVGAEIVHSYWVKNKGPAVIGDATLRVSWPMRTEDDEYLLYLAELRITGDGECYVDPDDLNPDSLQLNYYPYDSYVSHRKEFNGSETDYSDIFTRRRRDTGVGDALSETLFSPTERPLNKNAYDANCFEGYAGCVNIVCNITNFSKNSGNVVLTIRSRLYTKTVQNPESRPWNIVSSASFTINRLPYVAQPANLSSKSQKLSLWVTPKTRNLIHSVPLWAIILSVALGNLLMICLIFCLWKVGFFKRNRVRRMHELLDEDGDEKNGKGMEIVHVSHDCQVNRVE
ncbi:Integrin alpha-8 [Holothuria leucospilota]|uniref:Integrin alpha-8 n=1 Tax=Holothuria leucospilota TaxID=206669 RepID=A0A9Q0YNR6_HOLLE|nr:Integrin alpha-8 [Holothuria leucospilota]